MSNEESEAAARPGSAPSNQELMSQALESQSLVSQPAAVSATGVNRSVSQSRSMSARAEGAVATGAMPNARNAATVLPAPTSRLPLRRPLLRRSPRPDMTPRSRASDERLRRPVQNRSN